MQITNADKLKLQKLNAKLRKSLYSEILNGDSTV